MEKTILIILSLLSLSIVQAQIPTNGLTGYYKFDNVLLDYSGNGYHGTSVDTTYFTSGIACQAAIIEDNLQTGIRINSEALNGVEDFTCTTFIKLNGFNDFNNLLNAANTAEDNVLNIGYNNVNSNYQYGWHIRIYETLYNFDIDLTINDLQWHHLAIVREGNAAKLFLDGVQSGSQINVDDSPLEIAENGLIIGQDQDCLGGCFDPDQNWDGEIDEMRFYDRAVTSNEVQTIYSESSDCVNTIVDTNFVIVYDSIAVTDTLIINIPLIVDFTPIDNIIQVYPNPSSDIIHINTGNYTAMTNYSIELINNLGAIVFESSINQQEFMIDVNSFNVGLYFIKIIDNNNQIIDIRKILLQ